MTQGRYVINMVGEDVNGVPLMRPPVIDVGHGRGVILQESGVKVFGPAGFVLYPWHVVRSVQFSAGTDDAPAAVPSDCPWCTDTYNDLDAHLRVCRERLGPQDTARLRLVRGS